MIPRWIRTHLSSVAHTNFEMLRRKRQHSHSHQWLYLDVMFVCFFRLVPLRPANASSLKAIDNVNTTG
jgi:hypothetical protein